MKYFPYKLASTILLSSLLVGCTGVGPVYRSSEPTGTIDISKIPNATPKHEPRSRYGNPRSYVVFGKRYYLLESSKGFVQSGIASWYGPNFHGKKTSTQETYDMYQMTAAHKTLPIPCYVEVRNLDNGRVITVRVNDRGPFHEGRIIDLSFVAAKKLDIVKSGTARVEIRVIDPSNPQAHRQSQATQVKQPVRRASTVPVRSRPVPVAKPNVPTGTDKPILAAKAKRAYIQLGAFTDLPNAHKLQVQIQRAVEQPVSIVTQQNGNALLYKVRIGPMTNLKETDRISTDLNAAGHYEHHVLFQ